MERLRVNLGERSYDICIGAGILATAGERLHEARFPARVAVISNQTVSALYAGKLVTSLQRAGFRPEMILLPDGEAYKNHATLMQIYDALIERGFDRHSGLVALGGGVIGDMVGFAAATYLRGIPFAQIPTTLLAQVDSSVGGKTGINHPLGKNLIGAFCQPQHVDIDVETLLSLPPREYAAGLAEVVKYGVIRDAGFFTWLENHRESLQKRERDALVTAVMKSCQIKANVVENDEHERSLRAILNYGHTFGHAVENLAGYGTYLHGEAVAIGMTVAAALSCQLDLCQAEDVDRIISLLRSFGLPVVPPALSLDACLAAMGRDKKVKDGVVQFVLNHGIGDCTLTAVADVEGSLTKILAHLQQTEA